MSEKFDTLLTNLENDHRDFMARLDAKTAEQDSRLLELEQKHATAPRLISIRNPVAAVSELQKSEEFRSFISRKTRAGGVSIPFASVLPEVKNTIVSDSDTNPNQRLNVIAGTPPQQSYLRQLLRSTSVDSANVDFLRQTGTASDWLAGAQFDAGSPAQYEGVAKKESAVTFTTVSARIATIAHFLRASRQVIADNPTMLQFVVDRLRLGLENKIEKDIIAGSAASGEMPGLTAAGNYTAFTPATADNQIDSVSLACASLRGSGFNPGLVILNPADIGSIERIAGSDGHYVVGQPAQGGLSSLWGVNTYASLYVTAGKFLVLDTEAVSLFNRQEIQVDFSESDDANFTKNLVTIRCEARMGLGVLLPSAVLYGDLTI